MTFDLNCYGDGIKSLADLVGDFDLRSPMDVHAWYRVEWQAIAELLGFSQELEATIAPLRVVRDRVSATNQAGLDAFARWLRRQRPGLSDSHARTQELVQDLTHVPGVRSRFTGPRFHEAVISLDRPARGVLDALAERGIIGGLDLGAHYPGLADSILVCATETKTAADIKTYTETLADVLKSVRAA